MKNSNSRIFGILEYWIIPIFQFLQWSGHIGIVEYWNTGKLYYSNISNIGILDSWKIPIFQYFQPEKFQYFNEFQYFEEILEYWSTRKFQYSNILSGNIELLEYRNPGKSNIPKFLEEILEDWITEIL